MLKKIMIRKMNDYARFCEKYCNVVSYGKLSFNIDFKKYFQKKRGFVISYTIENKEEEMMIYSSCWVTVGKQCEFDDHNFEKGSTLHFYDRIEDKIHRHL